VKGWSPQESETGKLTIRINPIAIGNTNSRLTSSEPDPRNVFQKTRDAVYGTGLCVIYLPLYLVIKAMAFSDSRDESGSASLRSYVPIEFWGQISRHCAFNPDFSGAAGSDDGGEQRLLKSQTPLAN
jgi:hypothetical protein